MKEAREPKTGDTVRTKTGQKKPTISGRCDLRTRLIAEVAAELCNMTLSSFVAKAVDETAIRVLAGDSGAYPSLEGLAQMRLHYMSGDEFQDLVSLFSELRQKDQSDPF